MERNPHLWFSAFPRREMVRQGANNNQISESRPECGQKVFSGSLAARMGIHGMLYGPGNSLSRPNISERGQELNFMKAASSVQLPAENFCSRGEGEEEKTHKSGASDLIPFL